VPQPKTLLTSVSITPEVVLAKTTTSGTITTAVHRVSPLGSWSEAAGTRYSPATEPLAHPLLNMQVTRARYHKLITLASDTLASSIERVDMP
jgi:hypothetical protein